jgi:hypothetical protein
MSSLRDIESLILLLFLLIKFGKELGKRNLAQGTRYQFGILRTVRAFIGIGKVTEWNWKGNINLIISYYGETEKCFLARF